ncbi:nSTAND3 domain-containing NTPase [Paracidovorax citrulli]
MNDYDFSALNDKEFEVLCTDLLGCREGVTFERFKPGRDRGVDGRFFGPKGGEWILQSKHRPKMTVNALVKLLETEERPKIGRLAPERYFLAVSLPLSRLNKIKIKEALEPYVRSPADILGKEDLNDLLAKNPAVEQRHFKLWIGSTAVLRHLLNKAVFDRSAFAIEEMRAKTKLYVATASDNAAFEKLEDLGTVILTGPAGIGKTTLAEQLVLRYVALGYQLVLIGKDIHDAEAAFEPQTKQVFYFDDFLGQNYLQALSGHEGTHIARFIKRVKSDRTKRFILTSRSTILNQGRVLLQAFQTNSLHRNEYELTIDSLTQFDRARILYNHLWHSELPPEFIDEIYQSKRYRAVIGHKNYNPRLIEYITDNGRMDGLPPSRYWDRVRELLDNPSEVWDHPFQAQLDDYGRALVLLVTLAGGSISEMHLGEAFSRFIAHGEVRIAHGQRDLLMNLKHLCGSLLRRKVLDRKGKAIVIELFNPSIGDFVLHRYARDLPMLRSGFSSLRSISGVKTLTDLATNALVDEVTAASLLKYLGEQARAVQFQGLMPEYVARLCVAAANMNGSIAANEGWIREAIAFIAEVECPQPFADAAWLLEVGCNVGLVSTGKIEHFIVQACEYASSSVDFQRLQALKQLLPPPAAERVGECLEDAACGYLTECVSDEIDDHDVFGETSSEDHMTRAKENLWRLLEEKFEEFGVFPSARSIELVMESYDLDERMKDWFREELHSPARPVPTAAYVDDIDDLFQRFA